MVQEVRLLIVTGNNLLFGFLAEFVETFFHIIFIDF